jgi:hypothetical protein
MEMKYAIPPYRNKTPNMSMMIALAFIGPKPPYA